MRAKPILDVLPPLLGAAFYAIESGILFTLLPLRLEKLGFTTAENGLVATAYAAGFLIGCLVTALLIRSVGHVRASSAFAAIAGVSILALAWNVPLPVILALRITTGIATAGFIMVIESWLNELVAPEWRGRLLTAYIIILTLFGGVGQLLSFVLDPAGSEMLILSAGAVTLALVPFAAVKVESPTPPAAIRPQLMRTFKLSPVGLMSCLYTGLIAATFSSIGPLYGKLRGFSQDEIIILMTGVTFGGLALQWPLGYLSDRLNRRRVLGFMTIGICMIASAVIEIADGSPFWVSLALLVLFGGMADSFYPIGVAHTNDWADDGDYVSVSSNLLLVWALGSMVGPMAASSALEYGGPEAFFWYVLVLSAALGLYILWRANRRERPTEQKREEFVAYPQTSPTVFEWSPHKPIEGDDKGQK
jgi:MFS family permease